MNRIVSFTLSAFLLICVVATAARAPGQSFDGASVLYSHGVHAYFSGSAGEAEQYLGRAIASTTDDPRVYYFRGLSRLRLGRDADARHDFGTGAALEARYPNRYAVGAALERVQGNQRLLLEQYRRRAREQYAVERETQNRDRYEELTTREADVLRQRTTVPLEQLVPPGPMQPAPKAPSSAEAGPALTPSAPAPNRGATERPAFEESGDPFTDDPTSTEPIAPQEERSPASGPVGAPEPNEASSGSPDVGASRPNGSGSAEGNASATDEENPFDF